MNKRQLRKTILHLSLLFAIFGPLLLHPFVSDCFSGWFGTEGFLRRMVWKTGATFLCSFITTLEMHLALRSISVVPQEYANNILICSTFIWSMAVGTLYHTIIL